MGVHECTDASGPYAPTEVQLGVAVPILVQCRFKIQNSFDSQKSNATITCIPSTWLLHTHVHSHTYTHTLTHTHTHTHLHTQRRAHTHTHTHRHTCSTNCSYMYRQLVLLTQDRKRLGGLLQIKVKAPIQLGEKKTLLMIPHVVLMSG